MFKVFLSLGNEQFSSIGFSEIFNLCIQYFSQNPSEQEYTGSGEIVVGNASTDILVLSGNIDSVVPAAGDGRPRVLFNRQGSSVAVGGLSLPPEQSLFLLNNRIADSNIDMDGGMFLDWDGEYYCKWED